MWNPWIWGADCTMPFYVRGLEICQVWYTWGSGTNSPWIPKEDCMRKQTNKKQSPKKIFGSPVVEDAFSS